MSKQNGIVDTLLKAASLIKIPILLKGKTLKSGAFIYNPDATARTILGGVFHHAMRYRSLGDDRPDDELDWATDRNIVTNVGLQHILDTEFKGGSQSTTWYLGIFSSNYTPTATDTAAILTTSYGDYTYIAEATRPVWNSTRSGQLIGNGAAKATFTASGGTYPATIYGPYLINNNTKGGVVGTLMAASKFGASRQFIAASDELIIQYDISATSA